jgi:hypothetical protein
LKLVAFVLSVEKAGGHELLVGAASSRKGSKFDMSI